MSRAVTVALLAVSAAGCLTTGPSEEERRQLGLAYIGCMRGAARELDDGRSDLLTVALAVKAKCGPEWLAYTRSESAGLTQYHAARFLIDQDTRRLDDAAQEVATERTKRTARAPAR